jgi:hypothetical protein
VANHIASPVNRRRAYIAAAGNLAQGFAYDAFPNGVVKGRFDVEKLGGGNRLRDFFFLLGNDARQSHHRALRRTVGRTETKVAAGCRQIRCGLLQSDALRYVFLLLYAMPFWRR